MTSLWSNGGILARNSQREGGPWLNSEPELVPCRCSVALAFQTVKLQMTNMVTSAMMAT